MTQHKSKHVNFKCSALHRRPRGSFEKKKFGGMRWCLCGSQCQMFSRNFGLPDFPYHNGAKGIWGYASNLSGFKGTLHRYCLELPRDCDIKGCPGVLGPGDRQTPQHPTTPTSCIAPPGHVFPPGVRGSSFPSSFQSYGGKREYLRPLGSKVQKFCPGQ